MAGAPSLRRVDQHRLAITEAIGLGGVSGRYPNHVFLAGPQWRRSGLPSYFGNTGRGRSAPAVGYRRVKRCPAIALRHRSDPND